MQVKIPGSVGAVGTMSLQARDGTGLSTKPGTALAFGKWFCPPVFASVLQASHDFVFWKIQKQVSDLKVPILVWVEGMGEGCAKEEHISKCLV